MDISFIINSYGRSYSEIKNSLKSCLKQSPENFSFEVLFIDQNKVPLVIEDDTVIHLPYQATSISKARNYGALQASGDWLIFVDDDAILEVNYLEHFNQLTKLTPSCAAWAGSIYHIDNPQIFYSKRQNITRDELGFLEMKVFMGGNILIRRDLFAAVGKFDEEFGIGSLYPSSEDTDLAWRLYYAGFTIRLSHELRVFHPAPTKISMKKAYLYGLGKGALVGKWLIKQHKPLTILEFGEMLLVPLGKMVIDLKASAIHLATFWGRLKGFIRYAF